MQHAVFHTIAFLAFSCLAFSASPPKIIITDTINIYFLCKSGTCCRRVSVRPPVHRFVRPSVRRKPVLHRKDWTNRAGFLAWRLLYICPILCYKEISVSRKLRYIDPCKTLSETLYLENFATACRSRCQQNSSTAELVHDTYTTVDESWLFTTRRSTVTL